MSLFKKPISAAMLMSLFLSNAVFAQLSTDFQLRVRTDKEIYSLEDTVTVTLEAENYTTQDVTLTFSTGCQMGVEVFKNEEPVYNEELFPRNCSTAETNVIVPSGKKAVWTRTLKPDDEGYPFTENAKYKIHGYLKDYEDDSWFSQTTSFAVIQFGDTLSLAFNDIENHWAKDYIQKLADLGFVEGYDDGGYHPDDFINRAEIVKLALAASAKELSDTPDDENFKFNDLDDWQIPYVYTAWKDGIVKGYDELTYAPAKNVTRAEAVKITLLAFNVEVPDTATEFAFEDTIGHWAASYINVAFVNYIVSGREENMFYPDDPITRAEAAKIIVKLLES